MIIVISGIGFACCHLDHSVFVCRTKFVSLILAVYVDDILLSVSDFVALVETKKYLKHHFVMKDMGKTKYFLEIGVANKKYRSLSVSDEICS